MLQNNYCAQTRRHAPITVLAALCGLFLAAGEASLAQDADANYPARPVRVIVPYSPGDSSDTVARILGQKLGEFIAAAGAQPGKLNYGSGGSGSITHLTGELFKLAARVNIVHVPYKSIALATTDVIGGQVQAAFPTIPGAAPHARAGRLRALAITSTQRSGALPEVPTFEESGVADMIVTNWFGVFAPARLPKEILARLHNAVLDAMRTPDVRAKFVNLSLEIKTTTPQEFATHLKSELEKWGKVVKAAGIKPD